MAKRDLVIRVAGEAGEGVLSTGQLITQAAARAGFGVLTDSVPPAEIKGGHSFFQIRLSDSRLHSRGDQLDILLAFNEEAFVKNIRELAPGGVFIYDSAEFTPPESGDYRSYPLPLTDLAKNQLQFELGKNVVAVGAVAGLFGLEIEVLNRLITERFGRKGEDVLNKNLRALELGRRYVEEHIPTRDELRIRPGERTDDMMVVSGNTAIGIGSVVAGCRRYAGYPITPATDIMEFLAAELPRMGGAVIQAEDEIAAIGMVLGASFAGQKSMTATSGPGLSLMTEMLGLAGMAELPAVIVDCQRAGPSTGMPTRHEQGDLLFAVYGGHGELPRIVLAPVSVTDCFYQAINAFNLSEQFQMPVILLSDTVLAVRSESVPKPNLDTIGLVDRKTYAPNGNATGFLRYKYTEDGVSAMSVPGTPGGQYVATGLEHSESARPRYDSVTHADMTRKRFAKLGATRAAAPPPHRHGDPSADIGVITWGSTWGAVVEAVDLAAERGLKVDAIAPRMLWPVPDAQLRPFMEGKRTVIVPEVNYTGQYVQILQAHFGMPFERFNVFGGAPFKVSDLVTAIEGVYQHVG